MYENTKFPFSYFKCWPNKENIMFYIVISSYKWLFK